MEKTGSCLGEQQVFSPGSLHLRNQPTISYTKYRRQKVPYSLKKFVTCRPCLELNSPTKSVGIPHFYCPEMVMIHGYVNMTSCPNNNNNHNVETVKRSHYYYFQYSFDVYLINERKKKLQSVMEQEMYSDFSPTCLTYWQLGLYSL